MPAKTVTGFGDVLPIATLRWNAGVHNYMTYITGDIPVGTYDSTRLSNVGIGHGAIDAGGGNIRTASTCISIGAVDWLVKL
jgi:hypothetical protein